MSSVILLLRAYAFSGRKKWVLTVLSITFATLLGFMFWVMSRELTRLYRGLVYRDVSLTLACSVPHIRFDQPHRLFRRFRPDNYQCKRNQSKRNTFWISLGSAFRTSARFY